MTRSLLLSRELVRSSHTSTVAIVPECFERAFEITCMLSRRRDHHPQRALFKQETLPSSFCGEFVLRRDLRIEVQVLGEHTLLGDDVGRTVPCAAVAEAKSRLSGVCVGFEATPQ